MPDRLVMVEDDETLAAALGAYLRTEGFEVEHYADGKGVVERIKADPPEVVLLDIELPGESGLSICSRLRADYDGLIVMVTARDTEMDEVIGLELGADDYLSKPVSPRALVLRLAAHRRRGRSAPQPWRHADPDILIDRRARSVEVAGESIELTTGQFELLWLLVANLGQPVSRDQYYAELRGIRYDGTDRTMDARLSALRSRLVDAGFPPDRFRTVRGVGYQLAPHGS